MKKIAGDKFHPLRLTFLLFTGLILVLSIWGPEGLARYRDREVLDKIYTQKVETAGEGYRYTLSSNEKLYILSESLSSQILPESEQYALTGDKGAAAEYQELSGTYAFIVNHRGPSEKEITDKEIYETCNSGLNTLSELGILPDTVRKVEEAAYDAILYSAIDVLEPRNNVAVWKISLSNRQINANKENRLIDAYIDADSGKIYEFYARTALAWEDIDPDKIMEKWSEYMGLSKPAPYKVETPLMESTPYFKKYIFSGSADSEEKEKTIVTIGFYEGINEIFIKISR